MYLIGSDIGTQGTKSVIVNEKGEVLAEAFREYEVITPKPNWAEQWPDVWVKAVFETVKEVVEKSGVSRKEIAGIAISGLYGGSGIPVDKTCSLSDPVSFGWTEER